MIGNALLKHFLSLPFQLSQAHHCWYWDSRCSINDLVVQPQCLGVDFNFLLHWELDGETIQLERHPLCFCSSPHFSAPPFTLVLVSWSIGQNGYDDNRHESLSSRVFKGTLQALHLMDSGHAANEQKKNGQWLYRSCPSDSLMPCRMLCWRQ